MATKLVIPVASASQLTMGKESYFIAIAPLGRLPFDKIPMDANLRRAGRASGVVRDMLETLTKKPRDFLKGNLGIVLIAEDAHLKYDAAGNPTGLYVEMLTGLHGAANGGHTLTAILLAWQNKVDLSEAHVVIRVNVGVPDAVVKESVVHLNSSQKVDRRSILNKHGVFDDLKAGLEELGFTHINYYQNQAQAENRREDTRQSVVHIIKMLTAVDQKRFNSEINITNQPTSVVGAGASVLDQKNIARAEDLVLNFLPIAAKVEKAICQKVASDHRKLPGVKLATSIKQHSLMPDNTSIPYKIPSVFALPVVAALRAFIEDDEWQLPMEEIWSEVVDVLWKEYSAFLRKEWDMERRNIGGILSNKDIWIHLYSSAQTFHRKYLRRVMAKSAESNGRVPGQVREKTTT